MPTAFQLRATLLIVPLTMGVSITFLRFKSFSYTKADSPSSNALPEVLWSGALDGNERVGPTAVMEAASLLLKAASCEASYDYNPALHASCLFL